MHTVFALLCFVMVIHWLIFPYPSGLLHWHCGNLTIAPVPAKQPWWIWINTSCEFIMNDCITTTKQSTTKPCAYFLGYTVYKGSSWLTYSPLNWDAMIPMLWHYFPQDCHLQEHSRSYYAPKSQLINDARYDIYEPLNIEATTPLMSMTGRPIDLLNKLSVGCFADDADDHDLSYHMFTSGLDMNIEKCQTACRQQAFKYAGLQVHSYIEDQEFSLCSLCGHCQCAMLLYWAILMSPVMPLRTFQGATFGITGGTRGCYGNKVSIMTAFDIEYIIRTYPPFCLNIFKCILLKEMFLIGVQMGFPIGVQMFMSQHFFK